MRRPAAVSPPAVLFAALSWLFACEALRALLPLLVFGLRDRFRWSALGAVGSVRVGLIALAFFSLAFLAGTLTRTLGPRRALAVVGMALGLGRLGLQLWHGDPLGQLALVMLVAGAFLLLFPALLPFAGGRATVLGVLLGAVFDIALHGFLQTIDLVWRKTPSAALVAVVLVVLHLTCLRTVLRADPNHPIQGGLRFAATGPFLFLHLLVLGNLARLTTLTDWPQEMAYLWMLVGQGAALLSVQMADLERLRGPQTFALGIVLAASLTVTWPQGDLAAALVLGGQALAALLFARALGGPGPEGASDKSSLGHGAGMFLVVVLFFLYYGSYDLSMPVPNSVLAPFAALVLGGAAAAARYLAPSEAPSEESEQNASGRSVFATFWPVLLALSLCLLPLLRFALAEPGSRHESTRLPLRVMSYNLHCGFGPDGMMRLEDMAQAIEAEGADIVALQEVSRGWVMNGSIDMLDWLARRLRMHASYAPTADPLWGNAVLSNRPLGRSENHRFEHGGVHIRRAALEVEVPLAEGEPLRLFATHFHHRRKDSHIRVEESQAVLEHWNGAPRTILLGDLNATPESPEMELLRQSGFRDVLDIQGVSPGYTFRTTDPAYRIDYILITPDLDAENAAVPESTASDHFAVVATVTEASAQEAP